MQLTNTLLHQLSQLIYSMDMVDLSEQDICTMDTILFAVVDVYLQSEITLKNAIARMIGDSYICCLVRVNNALINSAGRCLK